MNEQATMMNPQQQQQQPAMTLNHNMMSLQPQPQMVPMSRGYGMWPPHPHFQKPNPSTGGVKPPLTGFKKSLGPRSNWKGKKVNNPNDKRRNDQQKALMAGSIPGGIAGGINIMNVGGVGNPSFNSYQPPTLNELQQQNRVKTRKFFPKKKFNKNNGMNMNVGGNNNFHYNTRSAPFAPRNTTSFLIRAKKSGGIAALVSPSPKTPAVLPTPMFSPSREVLVDMAKEEWGVDGYGSMKGLIRLRSPGHEMYTNEDDEEDEGGSSDSDLEEHVEVERRLDHDLSRFEMIYNPSSNNVGVEYHNVLENRVDDQDTHIAQLEEENLLLKERLFLMERELGDLRRRMQNLERKENRDEIHEEVMENDSEDESVSRGEEAHSVEDNNDLNEGRNTLVDDCPFDKDNDGDDSENVEGAVITKKNVLVGVEKDDENNDDGLADADRNINLVDGEGRGANNNEEFVDVSKVDQFSEPDKPGDSTNEEGKSEVKMDDYDANRVEGACEIDRDRVD